MREWVAESAGDTWSVTHILSFFGLGLLLFVVLPLIFSIRSPENSRHRRQIAAWARSRPNVEYRAADDSFSRRFLGPPFVQRRRLNNDPLCINVASGRESGTSFVHLDYHPPGSDPSTCVVAVSLPRQFPDLLLRPYLHVGDVNLQPQGVLQTESEDFNRRFLIYAYDPRIAHGMLTPRVMECLLKLPDGVTVRVERADILCYRFARFLRPKEYAAALSALQEVSAQLPHAFAIT
ncbi:MAG TPA: DUF3137 domain-containing protein [Mycobacteriales bacterium]|nr:DUF3137 domain-containing protein [Mycobacteriales bacterium]